MDLDVRVVKIILLDLPTGEKASSSDSRPQKATRTTKTSSLRSACCSWLCCSGGGSSSNRADGDHQQQQSRRSGGDGCLRLSNGAAPPSGSDSCHSVYEVASADPRQGISTSTINHTYSTINTVNNTTNMKNGRKISPISSDLPPFSLRHPQAAVIRQKGCMTTTTVLITSAESTTMADCRRFLSGGRLESFQNKLVDMWSNGLLSGGNNRRVNNMRQATQQQHKFSLEQQPNRDEAQVVLANRGTRSLPATFRPQYHTSSLPASIADCLKLAASPAALERALEMMETEEEEATAVNKSSGYYFEQPHLLYSTSTDRQQAVCTAPNAESKRSKASRTTLTTTVSPLVW
uniref:Uncharacterized protein n=1 Tax=Ditylenchus dipsaci TaxID=166011 RepID=A0A915D5X6_9BILA